MQKVSIHTAPSRPPQDWTGLQAGTPILINNAGTEPVPAVVDRISDDHGILWAIDERIGTRRLYLASDEPRIGPDPTRATAHRAWQ